MRTFRFLIVVAMLVHASTTSADKSAGEVVDDVILLGEVKSKVLGQDFAEGLSVNVAVRKGVVQLGGFIEDGDLENRLLMAAMAVPGVVEVDDELYPFPGTRSFGQVIDDGVTTTRVKAAIANVDITDAFGINVDTHNGVVLLTGFVGSAAAKARAATFARKDPNTKEVLNGLYVME